jgi:hypothetical protein
VHGGERLARPGCWHWRRLGNQARPTVVLTLANFSGISQALDPFADQVRRLSAGTMRIDIKSNWRIHQVDFETGLIGDVRAGKADLGAVGAGAWDSVGVSSFRALNTPLLIDSYALQDRVVHDPMIGEMLQGLRPAGLARCCRGCGRPGWRGSACCPGRCAGHSGSTIRCSGHLTTRG